MKELTSLLIATAKLIKSELREKSGNAVSFDQLKTMLYIKNHGKPTMKEIADHLAITPPSATSLVENLAKHKFVSRIFDERDRRIIRLEITPAGKKILENCYRHLLKTIERVFSNLNEKQVANLKDILKTLVRHYKL